MKEYEVEIIETLSRRVKVNADSWSEAKEIAKRMYYSEEIVLNDNDFYEVDFFVAIDENE